MPLSKAEEAEIFAQVETELPLIKEVVVELVDSLRRLSDVGQKHAIALLVGGWLIEWTHDEPQALALSEHLRGEIDKVVRGMYLAGGQHREAQH